MAAIQRRNEEEINDLRSRNEEEIHALRHENEEMREMLNNYPPSLSKGEDTHQTMVNQTQTRESKRQSAT